MKKILLLLYVTIITSTLFGQTPIMHWNFDKNINRKTVESTKFVSDTLEGLYSEISGIKGKGILLDGFTTRIVRNAKDVKTPSSELTIEAWIALGNYPWNWCPILTTESNEIKGYRLMVGPLGQVSMQVAIGEQWIVCTTAEETIPLRKWMHVTGTYSANNKLEIYVNGELLNTVPIQGKLSYTKADCIIGMTAMQEKPSDLHRTWGTQAQYFGLDGIIDEVKVYDKALTLSLINSYYSSVSVPLPQLQPRHLPIAKSTGAFKAYYTKLKYYPGWDNVWRVGDDPDIVVCFKDKPIKLIFWRGIRYGASWVSENENWMSDQSVEAWGVGDRDKEGCFEHMQDRKHPR
ncbi:MAG: LamG domain-containing protein [Bacteroidales bacterium]